MAAIWDADVDPTTGVKAQLSKMSVQAATEAAPTLATEGQPLVGIRSFIIVVEADLGQTLLGTGTLSSYLFDNLLGLPWARGDFDIAIPATAAGLRRWASVGWTISNPRSAIAHIASGVGVSAGGVTLHYCCTDLKGFRV